MTYDETDYDQVQPMPTLYVDGDEVDCDPLTMAALDNETCRLRVSHDEIASGAEPDPTTPLGWCNSAAVWMRYEHEYDEVQVAISVGDPRGAFTMSIRRIPADADTPDAGRLVLYVPHPTDPGLHMPLEEIRPGAYRIGS